MLYAIVLASMTFFQPKGSSEADFSVILPTFQSVFWQRTITFRQKQNNICNSVSVGFYG